MITTNIGDLIMNNKCFKFRSDTRKTFIKLSTNYSLLYSFNVFAVLQSGIP